MKKIYWDNRGNAILEFALVFPVFIALILGTINIAVLLHSDIMAASAARTGGRTAAVTGDREKGEAKARKLLEDFGLVSTKNKVSITSPDTEYVTATVTCRVPVVAPGFAALFGGKAWDNEITLTESYQYYVEFRHRR